MAGGYPAAAAKEARMDDKGDETKGSKGRGRKPRIPAQGIRLVAGQDVQQPGEVVQLPGTLRGQGKGADGLTAKQRAFADHVSTGCTLSDAYRRAYDAAGMSNAAIWREASDLMSRPMVAARVDALVAVKDRDALHDAGRTRRAVLEKLHATMTDAKIAPAVQLRAAELLGKTLAMFTDRTETEAVTPDQGADAVQGALEARLAALLQAG
jgi:hypothetical protein